MRKFGLTLTAAVVLAVTGATTASAADATGTPQPCATQQAVFDKYGIGLNMYAPPVGTAYGTICGVTG